MTAIEQDRRNSERLPRLSARLESCGSRIDHHDGFHRSLPDKFQAEGARIRRHQLCLRSDLALVFHEALLRSGAPKRKNAPELG